MPALPNSNGKICDAEVHNLFKTIKDFKPKIPSAHNTSDRTVQAKSLFITDISKHPHCKKCSHLRKGHSYQKVSKTTNSLYCPKMICKMDRITFPCKCEWHLKEPRLQSNLQLPNRGFYNIVHFNLLVQELLLPSKAS